MKPISAQKAWEVLQNADCLYKTEQVEAALDSMASRITHALAKKDPIVVCIMNGGMVPFGKLLPKLSFPLQVDYVHVTRYREKLHGGELHWIMGPHVPARDRVVLLVDDILDEGMTLLAIEERFLAEGAAAVHKAVLVVKNRSRAVDVTVEFAGLEVPDRYVFGYGMDYKGYLRNAPGIYAEPESQ
ncbi:MAG: hypoxanthine-guanine phosphoribosyltransferase [Acidiferrobacterales bacterium]